MRLPERMSNHCLTYLNKTHVLLTGGYTLSGFSSAAYIYNEETGFTRIDDMKDSRYYHRCSVINESTVLVAGGDDTSTTEYLDLISLTWSSGSQLPEVHSLGSKR